MKVVKLHQISQKGPQEVLINADQVVMIEEEKSPGLVQAGGKSKVSFATGGHIVVTEDLASLEKTLK